MEYSTIITDNESKLTKLRKKITDTVATVENMSRLLKKFSFDSFTIEQNPELEGTYRLVRPDGTSVTNTLSEGETNFIAFLYFFYRIRGGIEVSGIDQDKVVVIDDPVCSMDSDTLFIVTALIKGLYEDCDNKRHGICQLFILTHNTYFFTRITRKPNRDKYGKHIHFWLIKKRQNISTIEDKEQCNPIRTSYQLLWEDVYLGKYGEGMRNATLGNTMRRIIESYFNTIGDLDYEKKISEMAGDDRLICDALVKSLHAGSHIIVDDFEFQWGNYTLAAISSAFELLFEKLGHHNHFRMMMDACKNNTSETI